MFKRGNEVVVTYTGTNEGIDWLANLALGFAAPSSQLVSAARIYLEWKNIYLRTLKGSGSINFRDADCQDSLPPTVFER